MATATAALCTALSVLILGTLFAASATAAAPYPPTAPCSVSATTRGPGAAAGSNEYDVVGYGLGSAQPVRVVLTTTGQQVGAAQTDTRGSFRTVVTAPVDIGASAPNVTASTPQQTCSSPPPTGPTSPGSRQPTRASPTGGNPDGGSGGGPGDGSGGGPGNGTERTGSGPASNTDVPGSSGGGLPSRGSTSDAAPGSTTPAATSPMSVPPLAEPLPGSDTPLGIGLGIAAVLLVLGTLAVLLLTRRPEH